MQQRVLLNTPTTLTIVFEVDGVATDPSPTDATVTITRADGTPLLTDEPATRTAVGTFDVSLTAAQNDRVDALTVAWTSSLGTLTTFVEIVGGFLFTIAEARMTKPLDDVATHPSQRIIDARTLAETALEEACSVAFVPRYFTERLDGKRDTDLLLSTVRPLTITACTVDGVTVAPSELELYADGRVYRQAGWGTLRRGVTITGTHGYASPPPRVSRAAILLAKRFLIDSPVSDRATSLTTEDGTTQFLVTAGVRQAVFDIPECNAVVELYGLRDAYAVG